MSKAIRFDLTTGEGLQNALDWRSALIEDGARPVVEFIDGERSIEQNDHFYGLYAQINAQCQDQTVIDIRRECKFRYGLPILCAAQSQLGAKYRNIETALKMLTWEQQLEAMDILPVSSKMGKKQGSDYIETIIREYSKAGYSLLKPGEDYDH